MVQDVSCLLVVQTTHNLYRIFAIGNNCSVGKLQMERRSKIVLLALILLIVSALVMIGSYVQNIVIGYPFSLALALLGSIFWVNAE